MLEADGTPMSVRTALQLINRFLAEDDFDPDTQFCLHWFEQYGWKDGKFGEADTLARAKGTSVDGVKQAGVLYAAGWRSATAQVGRVPRGLGSATDVRLPVWEALHQLIRVFKTEGESGAGAVLAAVQAKAEATRQLAYRLYTLCERAGWAEDARAYNEIITSWSAIESAAARVPGPKQALCLMRKEKSHEALARDHCSPPRCSGRNLPAIGVRRRHHRGAYRQGHARVPGRGGFL